MPDLIITHVYRRFLWPMVALIVVLVAGTAGYLVIGGANTTIVDALYMTFITIATIGYGEIIDMAAKPGARIFTMVIAFAGIGVTTYIFSTLTAFIVAGELNQALRRRKMLKRIGQLSGHYIVCGAGRVGANVAHELDKTERPYVVVDIDPAQIAAHGQRHAEAMYILGDGTEDEMLEQAGIRRAAGVFAVTGDDSRNLVITLSSKQLNPACRVVARCHEVNYFSKMERVGADAIVSPDFTGGMRIVSSMIRPQVVSFLDEMLRSDDNVRVEQVTVGANASGSIENFAPPSHEYIVLALRTGGRDTVFNPAPDRSVQPGDVIVVMATPAGRAALESRAG
ncbi:MAG: potassium channel protein [Betaproteobacteria bacterium]|nr:potassium channel protein [Betaproteobacteria bacterium]